MYSSRLGKKIRDWLWIWWRCVKQSFMPTGTCETLKNKNKKDIDKQNELCLIEVGRFWIIEKFVHPITLKPEVTGCWYSGLWTLIGPTLVYLTEKKIETMISFFCLKLRGFRWNGPLVKIHQKGMSYRKCVHGSPTQYLYIIY